MKIITHVYHVAGLAHADVGNVSEDVKKKYYAINTDLAIETCKKAKDDGVKQFVFMSSAVIYAEFAYKCDEKYHPEDEGGVLWNDPDVNIEWPEIGEIILSDKDKKNPTLAESKIEF